MRFEMIAMNYVLLLLGFTCLVAGNPSISKPINDRIQDLEQQTQTLSEQEPKRSAYCFDIYKPELEFVALVYEYEYNQCKNMYTNSTPLENPSRQRPDKNEVWEAHLKLKESAEISCLALIECADIVGYLEAFECYAEKGAAQLKTDRANCINEAEKRYVKDTTSTYEELSSCLKGNSPNIPRPQLRS